MGLRERQRAGFTLIEIMVSISIISIILAIAFSNFSSFRHGRDLEGAQHELQQLLGYARQTAISQGGANVAFTLNATNFSAVVTNYTISTTLGMNSAAIKRYDSPDGVTVAFDTTPTASTFNYQLNGSLKDPGIGVTTPSTYTLTLSSNAVSNTFQVSLNTLTGASKLGGP